VDDKAKERDRGRLLGIVDTLIVPLVGLIKPAPITHAPNAMNRGLKKAISIVELCENFPLIETHNVGHGVF
jgi:hypothetical protein